MKRITFLKLNKQYEAFEIIGTKEYEDTVDDNQLKEQVKVVISILTDILKTTVDYRMEESLDGVLWCIRVDYEKPTNYVLCPIIK